VAIEVKRLQDEWYTQVQSYLSRDDIQREFEIAEPLYKSWIDEEGKKNNSRAEGEDEKF